MAEKGIYQRMHAVMEGLAYVQKGERTVKDKDGRGMYRFVSHDAVTAACRAKMVEHGIICVVSVLEHTQNGNRTDATINVRFVNIDKPDDFIEVIGFGYGIDTQDKGPGKAISYALKYVLLKAFMLETGDDPEKDQIEHESKEEQRAFIMKNIAALMKEHGANKDDLIAVTGKKSQDMTDEELMTVPATIIAEFPKSKGDEGKTEEEILDEVEHMVRQEREESLR